jgi:hypothetical protein
MTAKLGVTIRRNVRLIQAAALSMIGYLQRQDVQLGSQPLHVVIGREDIGGTMLDCAGRYERIDGRAWIGSRGSQHRSGKSPGLGRNRNGFKRRSLEDVIYCSILRPAAQRLGQDRGRDDYVSAAGHPRPQA